MTYTRTNVKKKNPPPVERPATNRWGGRRREIDVGRDYCILSTFRDEHQFNVTYFALQIRHGICHRLIRLDSTAPPQGICIP